MFSELKLPEVMALALAAEVLPALVFGMVFVAVDLCSLVLLCVIAVSK